MRILILLLLSIPLIVNGQRPIINSFSPTNIEVNQTVTISGSNLSGARVFFGGVEATVSSSTANTIKVLVPAGTRNDAITVLNNNLITQSSNQFFIAFSGEDISNYADEYLLSTGEVDGSDICLCDLNGDNLNDAIIAHNIINNVNNNLDSEITLFQNQSTFTNTQFTKVANINNDENNGGFSAVTCGDIDNDGKPDVIFTTSNNQNTKQIFVYKNTSAAGVSLTYQSSLSLSLPASNGINRTPRKIKIADIDGDGKSDLVVGNTLDNTIHVFRNTTSGSTTSFESPTEIIVQGAQSTGTIGVADLNNDGMPDIATLGFDVNNSGIFILKNTSSTGQIRFEVEEGIQQNSGRYNLSLGDFDNDGLIDLAATNRQLKRVRVYKNNSTNGDISFQSNSPTTVSLSEADPWGIDIGDLNGDGLLDIAVPSVGGSTGLFIIENTTSSSTISFGSPTLLSSDLSARNVCIADINGDAKPDLAYTQNITRSATTNLGVFTNQNCVVPSITPDDAEFCLGETFTLNATKSLGTTYAWSITSGNGDAITDTDSDATVKINSGTSATIQVTITNNDGCSESSQATFNLASGTPAAAPTITGIPTGTVCVGDNFTLTSSSGQVFEWTKPDGSIVSTESLDISSATTADGGTYSLRVKGSAGCFSPTATVDIEVSDAPSVSILNTELDNFCTGEDVELFISDLGTGFTYQWQLNGNSISSATSTSVTANQSGNYTIVVTNSSTGCSNTSDAKNINVIDAPSSMIDNNTQVCDGFSTNFNSSSTGETGFSLLYHWKIEDSSNNVIHTSTESSISNFTFPAGPANYNVTLTTGYDSTVVNGCGSVAMMAVEVSAPPTIEFDQVDGVQKCQGDIITVGISSPSSSEILSYEWIIRNAAATPNDTIITPIRNSNTIDISTPVNVDAVYAVATIITSTGCTVTDSIQVRNFESTVDISSPDGFDLTIDTVTLENEFFINLKAENLISDIQWSPEELIDNPTSESVRVFPDQQVVPVTVTGVDANNCTVTSQVIINIDIVRPKKTFSPNGDGKNDCWEVYNINNFACEVFIFDSRGRNILVTSEFDENCVWDGNSNGSPVPEGVYYYVIKCETDDISKSGSILLAR
ncbi:MAG: FG-GAP-like repeat-containing protein [Ekhidna sp.]